MRLQEYQSKALFTRHGIPIPRSAVAETPKEARRCAQDLGTAVAVKAQVLIGGRGKAGGVRLARTPVEAQEAAAAILGMDIKGFTVRELLIEEAVDIAQEIYLGVVLDRGSRRAIVMASAEGGVEIEQVARDHPEAIVKIEIDPLAGLSDADTLALGQGIGLPEERQRVFAALVCSLYETFTAHDAMLAEINPLVITGQGDLLALDGKVVVDDNALFRHPDLAQMRNLDEETPVEQEARKAGLSFVHLGGEIGCVVNGAGLAMATMDVIKHFGGVPANFLDVGGGASADRVATALRLVLGTPGLKAVLVNIFGGITLCDEVAQGIVTTLGEVETRLPMVVRLVGTNEEQGQEILDNAGYELIGARTLAEAAEKVVALAGARTLDTG